MNNVVINPYEYFADPTKGRPIFNGFVYIGLPYTDPEVPANQKQVYARQEDGNDVAIPQPVLTNAGGYPTYNGSVVIITVQGSYSVKVNDKQGNQLLYQAVVSSSNATVTATPSGVSKTLGEWTEYLATPEIIEVTATGTTTARSLGDRFADVLHKNDGIGIVGDGVTDDTTAVLAIDADTASSNLIDLKGLTLAVTSLPTKKFFYNGFWLIDGFTLDATDTSGIIANSTDTGGLEPAYTGGANNTPTVNGNSTKYQRVVVGSDNCRSQFPRSGNYTSIYSWAYGNVSANIAARQSVAGAPQSVNTASEECEVYGFRGLNGASIFSEVVASTGANIATRLSSANTTYSANVASNTSFAGGGRRARLEPVVVGGVVTDITIIDGGTGYDPLLDELRIVDRSSVHTVDATASYTVDGSGKINSVTMTNGGAGYIEDVTRTVAYVLCSGENQGNFATELSKVSKGNNSGNFSTLGCETEGSQSSCISSSDSNALGATRSVVLASTGSNSNAIGGVVISGNIVDADNDGAVVMGRRVKSANARSFVLGDAASGSALTANRKIELTAGGNVNAAGALTPSVVFTDYGEYFENLEIGEIPLGTIVTLKGDKVLPAKPGDDILGVVSATACIRAGDSWNHWAGRYLLDDYGQPVMHDVDMVRFVLEDKVRTASETGEIHLKTIKEHHEGPVSDFDEIPEDAEYFTESHPLENPDYDPAIPNIPRSERPEEWTLVGMLGQVYVNVSKECVVGDYVDELGMSSTMKTKLKVMKITREKDGFNIARCLLN